jgi:predicted O-linked N-acetylglucosamine transferase (SPINDLY family)
MKLTVDQAIRKAATLALKGHKADAEKLYREILQRFPQNQRAMENMRALQGQPDDAAAHYARGNAAKQGRRLPDALASYDRALRLDPDLAGAHYNRANTLHELGRLEEALASYDAALRLTPDSADACNNRGIALKGLNRLEEALASYDAALRLRPDFVGAQVNRGIVLKELRRLDEAVASYDAALGLKPDFADAHTNRGNALQELGRLDEALAGHDEALRLNPDLASAHYNRANVLKALERPEAALASYDAALRLRPAFADAHNNRGIVLRDLDRPDEALASYDAALRLDPDLADAHNNRGIILKDLERFDEALESYDAALRLNPELVDAHINRGTVLQELKRPAEALASYDTALRLKLDFADGHNGRGNALREMNRPEEALAAYDRALRLNPELVVAYFNRATVLKDLKRLDEAIDAYDAVVRLDPDAGAAPGQLLHQTAQICDWGKPAHEIDLARLGIEGDAVPPFAVMAMDDDPVRHRARARNWARTNLPAAQPPLPKATVRPRRLRIGYFSADYHEHATMALMARAFELHDRSRFEIHAFSYGPDRQDPARHRALAAFDRFHHVRQLTDAAAAGLAREMNIDIAVDLGGYTRGAKTGIFAHRAAPVQMSYLGFPGSMGVEYIDYIVADPIVLPREARQYYDEKVITLPHSYQVNDRGRPISARYFSRGELGLPGEGFVFCCFNNNYKISPAEFDIWMRLLSKVGDSVLWLLEANKWAKANLRKEAEARGVDPQRLVFAERVAPPLHLARHRCADLFLDTFHYNAHTTGSDALWGGLPLVTKMGRSFPSRVAASLLTAIGLPELVTASPDAYEQLALDLATNRDRLRAVKAKLAANRLTTPLFDTEAFTRHIEHGYEMAYDRYFQGLPPDHITISAI